MRARTTISFSKDLYKACKIYASLNDKRLSDVIEQAVYELLKKEMPDNELVKNFNGNSNKSE